MAWNAGVESEQKRIKLVDVRQTVCGAASASGHELVKHRIQQEAQRDGFSCLQRLDQGRVHQRAHWAENIHRAHYSRYRPTASTRVRR